MHATALTTRNIVRAGWRESGPATDKSVINIPSWTNKTYRAQSLTHLADV